jgi:hypothetical protein
MLDYLYEEIDLVLVMSVNPGFGGQSFISSQLRKIEAIRKAIDKTGRDVRLEVDGGVDVVTARQCVDAGADVLVAGSASFKGGPDCYAANIAALKAGGDEAVVGCAVLTARSTAQDRRFTRGPAIPLGRSDEGGLVNEQDRFPQRQHGAKWSNRAGRIGAGRFRPACGRRGRAAAAAGLSSGHPRTSTLAAPFRKPAKPRLLATVANPLPGSKVAGTALQSRAFFGPRGQIADRPDRFRRGGTDLPRRSSGWFIRSVGWPIWKPAPRAKQVAPVAERIMAAVARRQSKSPRPTGQGSGLEPRQCRRARTQLAGSRPADPVRQRQGAARQGARRT